MQPRPIHSVNEHGELRWRQPHHTVSDRRPPEGTMLEPLPEQHQPGPIPSKDLQPVCALRAEHKNRPAERILLELLAHQRGETISTATEVHRLGGHQHPHSRRNRDHVAALTARSTLVNVAASIPGVTRTVAAPITISIVRDPPGWACPVGASAHRWAVSTTTGTKADPPSPAPPFIRRRASRRQPNNCCGVNPRRRATAQTVSL